MKKLLAALAVTAALVLGACVEGGSLSPAQSEFLRDAAINRIAAFNDAGIQIVELDDKQLLLLDTACFAATTIAVFRADPEDTDMVLPQAIVDTCAVLMKLAAGDDPEPVVADVIAELEAVVSDPVEEVAETDPVE